MDALCRRYEVDNSQRELHGALLDAEILADVYLLMTGGQTQLFGQVSESNAQDAQNQEQLSQIDLSQFSLPQVKADEAEIAAHDDFLDTIAKQQEPIFRSAAIL